MLGGSSVLNAMLYARGNKKDYDTWEKMGNTGWSYNQVLKYFKKSEDMRIERYKNSPYHGIGGYLPIEDFKYHVPVTNFLLKSGLDMGYNIVDFNGATQTGFAHFPGTLRDGLRCSTAKAFLRPASKRKNLHISTSSMVKKILVGKSNTFSV